MATIRDVAKLAGVSVATVSHVINGRTNRVGAQTRERVLEAIRELRYNPPARSSRGKIERNQTIVLALTDLGTESLIANHYVSQIVDGALLTCARRGYALTIVVERVWDEAGIAVRRTFDGKADGMLIAAPVQGDPINKVAAERGIPGVLIGTTSRHRRLSSVDIDNRAVGFRAATELIERGHRRLLYLTHGQDVVSSMERWDGFERGAQEHCDDLQFFDFSEKVSLLTGHYEELLPHLKVLLSGPQRPTGIFVWQSVLARKVLRAAESLGFKVPDDLSIITVDDSPSAIGLHPKLSTFRNPVRHLVIRATEHLIQLIENPETPNEVVKVATDFLENDTVGPAPTQVQSSGRRKTASRPRGGQLT